MPHEKVRRLPHCHHVFHLACCDEWIGRELQMHDRFATTEPPVQSASAEASSFVKGPLCRTVLSHESNSRIDLSLPPSAHAHGDDIV
jgi:hypothetical protein